SDLKEPEFVWRFNDNQIALAYKKEFGKSKKAICHTLRGYFTGTASNVCGKELEAIETKCMAKGDAFCEFVIKEKSKFDEKSKLFREQLL
ncbi:MAG: 4-vinyl reductase, partial [archaeon]